MTVDKNPHRQWKIITIYGLFLSIFSFTLLILSLCLPWTIFVYYSHYYYHFWELYDQNDFGFYEIGTILTYIGIGLSSSIGIALFLLGWLSIKKQNTWNRSIRILHYLNLLLLLTGVVIVIACALFISEDIAIQLYGSPHHNYSPYHYILSFFNFFIVGGYIYILSHEKVSQTIVKKSLNYKNCLRIHRTIGHYAIILGTVGLLIILLIPFKFGISYIGCWRFFIDPINAYLEPNFSKKIEFDLRILIFLYLSMIVIGFVGLIVIEFIAKFKTKQLIFFNRAQHFLSIIVSVLILISTGKFLYDFIGFQQFITYYNIIFLIIPLISIIIFSFFLIKNRMVLKKNFDL